MKKQWDFLLELLIFLITTVVTLTISWLIFTVFGFQSDRPQHFVLFMIGFIALDKLVAVLNDWSAFMLVKHSVLQGFWQATLFRATFDLVGELGILLLLRNLPGIHIKAMGAYRFAFCWGLADVAVSCWDEYKNKNE